MHADPGSRSVLNRHGLILFPDETLEHRIARAICAAECLPRKEFHEAWQMARRVRRRMRGGRIFDLAAGHGVLGAILLLLDDTSPEVICVDRRRPASQARVLAALEDRWPRIAGRVRFVEGELPRSADDPLPDGMPRPAPGDLIVSAHGCGALTDRVLDLALACGSRVAVLPCCHDTRTCAVPTFAPWMAVDLAIDAARVARLEAAGQQVRVQSIPAAITPKNRLILAEPAPRNVSAV